MIYGIGTDIVQVARMQDNLNRYGDRFAERILAEPELIRFREHVNPAQFLAKRFAAKEATAKAFGTGFRDGLSLLHIVVENDQHGRPQLKYHEVAEEWAKKFHISQSHLSLSDEPDYAVAFVVLEYTPA